eukprot:TRINITY_DN29977_c0_g1_i1.p1 TRINITY_DN29977_c0_g1~~TRINITY_DN29977_c0_g1_i1.p1  ORF type:complete len:300 (-),score=44.31 TRINITY_DN29977_c0_g1_i1:40-804(-)
MELAPGRIADVESKGCRTKGFISESNGHACKVNGTWFHREDVKSVKGFGEELGSWRGVSVEAAYPLPNGALLCVSSGSVVDFEGDAIVNAANEGCLGGGGVDGAISRAGGEALYQARVALPKVNGVRCPTGEARITIGGELASAFCIHAVGPAYDDYESLEEGDKLVFSAYQASMACARFTALSSIGFSLLSSGIFRGSQSLEKVLEQAVLGIKDSAYPGLTDVHLVAFKREELDVLLEICDTTFGISASALCN